MSNPNTEREERLAKIQAARETGVLPWSHLSSPAQQFKMAAETLDYLLSLLDSQAACGQLQDDDELVAEMNTVAANLVRDWYCDSQHRDELVEEIAVTLTAAHRRSEADAATRMRNRCVAKVMEKALKWQRASNDYNDSDRFKHHLIAKAAAANELAEIIEACEL